MKKLKKKWKIFFCGVFRRHHVFNDPVNLIDPEGLKFKFADKGAEALFRRTYNASTGAARTLMDKLEKDSRTITVQQLCDSSMQSLARSKGVRQAVDGLTYQNIGGSPIISISDIAATPMHTLIHEIGHADQLFNGQTGLLPEAYPNSLERLIRGR